MEPKQPRTTQEGHHYLALQMLAGDAERRAAAAHANGYPDIAKTYRRIAGYIATIPAPQPPRQEVPGQTTIGEQIAEAQLDQVIDLEDHRPTHELDRILDRWEDCAIPSACKHREHRLRHDELGPIFEGLT